MGTTHALQWCTCWNQHKQIVYPTHNWWGPWYLGPQWWVRAYIIFFPINNLFLMRVNTISYAPFYSSLSPICHKLIPYITPIIDDHGCNKLPMYSKNGSYNWLPCPPRRRIGVILVEKLKTLSVSSVSTIVRMISEVIESLGDQSPIHVMVFPR